MSRMLTMLREVKQKGGGWRWRWATQQRKKRTRGAVRKRCTDSDDRRSKKSVKYFLSKRPNDTRFHSKGINIFSPALFPLIISILIDYFAFNFPHWSDCAETWVGNVSPRCLYWSAAFVFCLSQFIPLSHAVFILRKCHLTSRNS